MKKKLVWDKTGERPYETGVSQGAVAAEMHLTQEALTRKAMQKLK